MTVPFVGSMKQYNQPVAAISGDQLTIIDEAPFAATITSVRYIPSAAKSGAAVANSRTLNVYNRGTGSGTVLVATLALLSGTDLVDNVAKALTLQSASSLVLAAGDILEFESLHMSSGMTDPGGAVAIAYSRS